MDHETWVKAGYACCSTESLIYWHTCRANAGNVILLISPWTYFSNPNLLLPVWTSLTLPVCEIRGRSIKKKTWQSWRPDLPNQGIDLRKHTDTLYKNYSLTPASKSYLEHCHYHNNYYDNYCYWEYVMYNYNDLTIPFVSLISTRNVIIIKCTSWLTASFHSIYFSWFFDWICA